MRKKPMLPMMNADSMNRDSVASEDFAMMVDGSGDGALKLYIRDRIGPDFFGEGVEANDISEMLESSHGRDVEVFINSPGGDVYDGVQIYNSLAMHAGHVTVTIESLAFSAASYIAMAGDMIRMYETSHIGVHRGVAGSVGTARTMRAMAKWLDTIDNDIAKLHSDRTGLPVDRVHEYMEGDDMGVLGTLFSAAEAVDIGFADEIIKSNKRKPDPKSSAESNMESQRKRVSKIASAQNQLRVMKIKAKQLTR